MTIEEYVIGYLCDALSIPVSGNVPHQMPERFVTVELTGSSMSNYIPSARLSIECWGTSRSDSAQLYTDVAAAMLSMPNDSAISRVELETGYNDADMNTNRPRYTATFSVVYLF